MNDLGLIWMSAGNSYFTENRIKRLLDFADKKFDRIIVLSPDKPAEHTFRALGYTENKVRRKSKLNSNLLINRAKRILTKMKSKEKFHFVDWEGEILNNKSYLKDLKEIKSIYKNNLNFRKDARKTTLDVLANKGLESKYVERIIDEAVLYLIEEFAFIMSCPSIYHTKKVNYLYHHRWKIFEDFISGKYDSKKRKNFSFVLTGVK